MDRSLDILPIQLDLAWSSRLTDPDILRLLHLPIAGISLRRLWQRIDGRARGEAGQQLRRLGSGATRLALLIPLMGDDGTRRDVLLRARVVWNGDKRCLEGAVADLTTELRPRQEILSATEDRANIAVQELNHRVRNIMSVVTALITLSARFADDVQEFSAATLSRIQALNIAYSNTGIDPSRPHLIRSAVDMHDLANGVLMSYRGDGTQLTLSRATLNLSPGQASAMGLILHELATNAQDHGALGSGTGTVNVEWSRAGRQFEVRWEENDVDEIDPSFVDGFGMTIVKLFARNYLNGDARWLHQGNRLTVQIRGLEG